MKFDEAVNYLIKDEGGYVDDPDDSGGETKFGISKRAYPHLDIKNLTVEQAKKVYRSDYWAKVGADILPEKLRYPVFDFAVNAGVGTAAKMLQRLAGVVQDGKVGLLTSEASENVTVVDYTNARIQYYNALAKRRPKDKKYLKGWTSRAMKVGNRASF